MALGEFAADFVSRSHCNGPNARLSHRWCVDSCKCRIFLPVIKNAGIYFKNAGVSLHEWHPIHSNFCLALIAVRRCLHILTVNYLRFVFNFLIYVYW